MSRDRKLGKVFGEVSNLYASTRASYPQELIEDIIRISGIPEGGRIQRKTLRIFQMQTMKLFHLKIPNPDKNHLI
jgi:hypothetical protein